MSRRYFWAWTSIIVMWLAIAIAAFAGGGAFRARSSTGGLTGDHVAEGAAIFVACASIVLSIFAFRREA